LEFSRVGAPTEIRKPVAHILAIGVNRMPGAPGYDLRYAVNDAQSMGAELRSALLRTGGYESIQLTVLSAQGQEWKSATKSGVRSALEELAAEAKPRDLVIITFSGHGSTNPAGEFHIFPSDVVIDRSGRPRRPGRRRFPLRN
jgi:hypothetical protein